MKTCISCGSKFKLLANVASAAIWRCPRCGLGKTENGGKMGYSAYHRDLVYLAEEDQFANIFQKRINLLLRFKKRGKALEVGSSTGLLLSLLKKAGWKVQGVEPSRPAARVAQKRGIPTQVSTFEKAELPAQNFDAVIFNHTLEHLENPRAALAKAHQALKRGGLLLIDLPNFGSLAAKISGASWQHLLPAEHRWHFTKNSLARILRKVGFSPIFWETHSGIWGYGNATGEVWQSLTKFKKRFFGNILTAAPDLIVTKLGLGTGLTVLARKK